MRSTQIWTASTLIVAIALIVAALTYADAQSSAALQSIPSADQKAALERIEKAGQAEAAIFRADLVDKLEAALGDAFGGVWFEPVTAQLFVGVTSAVSRRNAEAVAAQEGLAESVTETSVDSTWAQLQAAQERWNLRLAGLFDQGEVSTSLAAKYNSVRIELASSVPSAIRAELERETAADLVSAFVEILPPERFRVTPLARCAKFVQFKAYCDPTIVAGMSIDNEKEENGEGDCTAGPAVINKERWEKEKATETFLLTAGHCIASAGGVGKKWYAFEKKGIPEGRKEVGKALAFLDREPGIGADVGVIKVERTIGAKANDPTPLISKIAPWNPAEETEPFDVWGEAAALEGGKSCLSGQRSGIQCGEILKTGKTFGAGTPVEEREVAEVKLKTGKIGKGDSGSPVFSESHYKEWLIGQVQGVLYAMGGAGEESEIAFFQPLGFLLAELKAQKKYDLELLEGLKEKRHGLVKASQYPATIHGSTTEAQKFTMEAGTVECKESSYHAVLSEASSTLTLTPEYKKCTATFAEGSATVDMEGCTYVLHVAERTSVDNYRAYMDISCPTGKSIKITTPGTCIVEIGPQPGLETFDLIDDTSASPKKDLTVRPTVGGIAYTTTLDGCFCAFNGTGGKSDGGYTSSANITLTGQNPSNGSEKIDIEIGDE